MSGEAPYYGAWESCDGLLDAEIQVTPPDGPWPSMVRLEINYGGESVGGTITAEDAQRLIAQIGAAASQAEYLNRAAAASPGAAP